MEVHFTYGTLSTSSRSSLRLSVGFLDTPDTLDEILHEKNKKWIKQNVNYLFPHEWKIYRKDISAYPYIHRVVCKLDVPENIIFVLIGKRVEWGKPLDLYYGLVEIRTVPRVFVRFKGAPSLWFKSSGKFVGSPMFERIAKHKQTLWW